MDIYQLTQTQLGIYMAETAAEDRGDYNVDLVYHLDAGIDIHRLENALCKTVDKHPYLKSQLTEDEEGHILLEDHSTDATIIEHHTAKNIASVLSEVGRPFTLLHHPLYRFWIYTVENGERILYIDLHHILCDGMSCRLLHEEIAFFYDHENEEQEAECISFELGNNEAKARLSTAYEEAKNWNCDTYGAAIDIDSMPIGDKYGNEKEQWLTEFIDLDLNEKALALYCEQQHIGKSIPFTAAFGYTLCNYTASEQALFATIWHGRNSAQTNALGMMVKTLPIYMNIANTPTIAESMQILKKQLHEARQNTLYSFADITEDPGIHPQICFAYQANFHMYHLILNGKEQKDEYIRHHRPGFEWIMNVIETEKGFACKIEYNTSKYTSEFVHTFCNSYGQILRECLKRTNLADIEPTDENMTLQLDQFNANRINNSKYDTLVSAFRHIAQTYPNNTAVIYCDHTISYRELDKRSEHLAHLIADRQSKLHGVTAILINRSEMMPICAIAAQKAGTTYQPLDPSYPQDRLNFMLADSGAQVLVCDRNLKEIVNDFSGNIIYTDEIEQMEATNKPLPEVHQDDTLILLYTSGSTGTPKGVILQQHNLISFCDWYCRYYQLNIGDSVLAYASFGFDANMMDTYPALITGATTVIVPEDIRLDLEALYRYMEEKKVTHSFMTTQVGYQFASTYDSHPTLKHLSIGGEKMASIVPPKGYKLHNLYGPTECSVISTCYLVEQQEQNIPIGALVDTTKGYIVNKYHRRLPWGAAGELIISGDQVGHGYLNNPDKTAEVFINYMGDRSYCTGDIVRYRPNGDIEFVGRRDGQVKIRGFRIELTEVESVIRSFEGITDCTVQAYNLESGGKYLAAYIVSNDTVDIAALNTFIAQQKPPYMVPAITMQIDAIPLNINQKVDKKRLPKPELKTKEATTNRPMTHLDKILVDIIKDLTGQEPDLGESLIYSGLSSILAMRLSVKLYKQFDLKLSGKDIINGMSIIDIENCIIERLLEKKTHIKEEPVELQKEIELSYAQQGIYTECLKHPESTVYNIPMDITLPLSADAEKVAQAVKKVISKHPMLMVHFCENDEGDSIQRMEEAEPIVDICQAKDIQLATIKKDFVRPFDLRNDRLYRVLIVSTESNLHLLLDVHHLVCDGASEDIILSQIISLLNGNEIEDEHYTYFAHCKQQTIDEAAGKNEEKKAYFANLLRDMEESTNIPADLQNKELGHIAEVYAPLPELKKIPTLTPAAFWLGATAYTIARYAGVKDSYFTMVSNGRQNPEIAETVGMFVNTLPIAIHIGEGSVKDYLLGVSDILQQAISHEDYPFARIAADYGYTANVTYAYQLGIIADHTVNDESVKVQSFGLDTPKFQLGIYIEMYQGTPSLVLQYDDALYSKNRMERLRDSIIATAIAMVSTPDQEVKHISIMSNAQRKEVKNWSHVAEQTIEIATMHQGISRWADITPDTIAVIACDHTLTYREYNEAAEHLADILYTKGVRKGDRIVLLLPRTSDFLVSALAVMKCGAAYIPMDPEYPADRIAYILNDSEGRYIITTSQHLSDYKDRALDIAELIAESTKSKREIVECTGEDLAYLIYTSGSTGKPKGVMLQHKGICNYLTPHPANPHTYAVVNEAKAILCSATVSFDLSILEYGTALFNGKTVILANETETTDSYRLAELYTKYGADVLSGTPSRIEAYMEMEEYRKVVQNCRVILMGGEKLPTSLMKRLQEMTSAKIFNMYGPTEITICCNAEQVNDSALVTVGKPLPNFTEHIIDCDMNELPMGVTGELIVSGVGVSLGYNNLPEKTNEAFIQYDGKRIYKTGDLAQWTADGKIIISGRKDHQVKLNGLRIELGEIETIMGQQPGIKQCVVQVRKVGKQDKLVAYFVVKEGETADLTTIKTGMAEHLTPYMIPGIMMQIEVFPITPAGKIDMKHLPEPQIETNTEFTPAANATEQLFCDIFAQVLQIQRVGATDNFFELGGTSLVAIKVVIAAKKKGIDITYSDVFEHPTPRDLSQIGSLSIASTDENNHQEAINTAINAEDKHNEYEQILCKNTLDSFLRGEPQPLKNVLLTGATGYLGIHILYQLLTQTQVQIFCPIRSKNDVAPAERLRTLLFYYFSDSFDQQFGKRIHIIEGEVTQQDWMEKLSLPIDGKDCTVINCLANVKHFSTSNDIEFVNVESVRNLINWCITTGAQLIHISTTSVAGRSINGYPDPAHLFNEKELNIGQHIDNRYAQAKYDAEQLVLDAILHHQLNAKIMRVGNLSARQKDGEFQVNFQSNNFMATLRAYQTLGVCPYALLDVPVEFSPIDEVADAIILLATTPRECTIFHPTNPHTELMGDVLNEIRIGGNAIRAVEQAEFEDRLQKVMNSEEDSLRIRPLMAYAQKGNKAPASIHASNAYTTQVLHRLGFSWDVTSNDYVRQFIHAIDGLGYFD